MAEGSSPSRAPISHPYPPSYRSELSPSPSQDRTPQFMRESDMPPSQSYAFDYQRRRDSRHAANPPLYPDPSSHPHPGYAHSPSPASAPMMSRDRSGSDSSLHPVLNNEGYPANWTKEDEEAEREFLAKGMVNWREMRSWRFWIRKEWWHYYLILILIAVLVILMSVYHDQIVDWLTPAANWMKALPAGWVIPIAILFIISFPPLFGHEIVTILIGAIWGLWVGFGITAAGTFLGELGNFYAFKYCLRSRAEKLERKNLSYACMAHVVREGGFFIIFVARLSAIPGHFTTAVFATCGMNIWIFSLACILTLPKQLVVVYLGVIFNSGEKSTKDRIISDTVLGVGFVLTILAAWYIYREMNKARVIVWRRQRMALAAQGVSTDPVTGARRASYKEFPEGGAGDAEVRSPILDQHPSYQNPYEISYRRNENISVYQVEGSLAEQDISYAGLPEQPTAAFAPAQQPTASFPQAHPAAGLRREPSTAPTVLSGQAPSPTDFPVPSPAQSFSAYRKEGGFQRGDQSPATYGASYASPPPSGAGYTNYLGSGQNHPSSYQEIWQYPPGVASPGAIGAPGVRAFDQTEQKGYTSGGNGGPQVGYPHVG